jgi:uncharacterized protein
MQFAWDEAKRQVNLRKHGPDVADASAAFEGRTLTFEDERFDPGEQYYITLACCTAGS